MSLPRLRSRERKDPSRLRKGVSKRTQRFVSIGATAAILAGYVIAVTSAEGIDRAELSLNDGGVWVTNQASRMVGHLDVSERLPVDIKGNKVRVDFRGVLAASKLGQTEFRGHRLMDMVEIEGAQVREGGIMFDTKLNVPDDVREALKAILKEKTGAASSGAEEGGTH